MATNWLELNDSKTEFMLFDRKQYLKQVITEAVTVGNATILSFESVKRIGAYLGQTLTLELQISAACKSLPDRRNEKITDFRKTICSACICNTYIEPEQQSSDWIAKIESEETPVSLECFSQIGGGAQEGGL